MALLRFIWNDPRIVSSGKPDQTMQPTATPVPGLATEPFCAYLKHMSTQQSLEERIAHLLRTVDDLSDMVARQDRDIAKLTHRVEMLMQREATREAEGTGGVILGDERPPHY